MIDRVALVKSVEDHSKAWADAKYGPQIGARVELAARVGFLEDALVKALNKLPDDEAERVMSFLRTADRRAA